MTKRIAIVGCGPAGLSCAIALHDSGFNVSMVEQFSQPGPVGSGLMLQPIGLMALDKLGLRIQAEQLGQRIDGMLGRLAPAGKIVLDVKYKALRNDMYGVAIHRASLFHILYNAVCDRKINITTGCKITSLQWQDNDQVKLIDDHGNAVGEIADLVIDASGVQSQLLKYAPSSSTSRRHSQANRLQTMVGSTSPELPRISKPLEFGALWTTVKLPAQPFDPTLLEQRYKKASIMVGVLPCGRLPESDTPLATLFWSIRAKDYQRWKDKGLTHWKDDVAEYWPEVRPLLEQIQHPDQMTHAVYSHHTLKKPYARSLIYVGDAAHATSPQLGQGANMALLDAMALNTALCASSNIQDTCLHYTRLRRNHVRLYQAISYLLTPFYQSDSTALPLLRDHLLQPISAIGFMNRFITHLGAGLLTDPLATINKNTKWQ